MYGTIAKFNVVPGKEQELMDLFSGGPAQPNGFIASAVYRADAGSGEYWIAVVFDSKESYRANAESPEQDAEYRQWRALLTADPEWHDGEVVSRVLG
jgi:heme-degrading monooxygenase HmoA